VVSFASRDVECVDTKSFGRKTRRRGRTGLFPKAVAHQIIIRPEPSQASKQFQIRLDHKYCD
jgi:hypothetical protein